MVVWWSLATVGLMPASRLHCCHRFHPINGGVSTSPDLIASIKVLSLPDTCCAIGFNPLSIDFPEQPPTAMDQASRPSLNKGTVPGPFKNIGLVHCASVVFYGRSSPRKYQCQGYAAAARQVRKTSVAKGHNPGARLKPATQGCV